MTDEGLSRAASRMESAAETMRQAADSIADSVHRLTQLVGAGYGNPVERLVVALEERGKMGIALAEPEAPESTKSGVSVCQHGTDTAERCELCVLLERNKSR